MKGRGIMRTPTKQFSSFDSKPNAQHFIDYILTFGSHMLKDNTWKSKLVKFSDKETVRTTQAVLLTSHTRLIEQYESFCDSTSYKGMGRSSLYRILGKKDHIT